MLFLPQLVVFPPCERELDVVLLALLCATTKKNDYLLAFFPKIQTISGTKIDPALVNASSNTLGIGEVPQSYAVKSRRHLPRGFGVQPVVPFPKRIVTATVVILSDVDHRLDGNIYCTIVNKCPSDRRYLE
jgi:hypothetical protein